MIGKLFVDPIQLTNFCKKYSYLLVTQDNSSMDEMLPVTGIEPLDLARANDISFCRFEDERVAGWLKNSQAGFVFLPPSLQGKDFLPLETTYIFADHPRLAILNFINEFWTQSSDEVFDNDLDVHPNATLGKNVKIGRYCSIGSDVTIDDNSTIGNNTTIMHATIGKNCVIGSNVTIGGDGFGFEDEDNEVIAFPHLGGVIIGDCVRIGSSTCVDRASLGNTIIEDHAKIDNLVHVAHNVKIGRAAKVIAMSIIGGSTTIGKNSWVAPGASLRDWISVGDNALVGLGAVVTRNVEDGQAVVGNPARVIEKTKNRYR